MRNKLCIVVLVSLLLAGICGQMQGQTAANPLSAQQTRQMLLDSWLGDQPKEGSNKCNLPAISFAIEHRAALSPAVESALTRVLMRDERQKSIVVGHFRIHYDTTGIHSAAMLDSLYQSIPGTADEFADSVAAIANYVFNYEVGTLGYLPPPSDNGAGGGLEYDIYVESLGSYGETDPENLIGGNPDGGTYTSFMRIDNDFSSFVHPQSNSGLPALRVTLAHEFHHAIQLGRYAYWFADRYFYEITSTWIEDVLFTDVNDYYNYVRTSQGQFARPEVSFTSSEPQILMYSRCIWGHYIAKKFGRDAMRTFWEETRTARPLSAMDAALQQPPYSTTFRNAFVEWSIWNYFTADKSDSNKYPEGRQYNRMISIGRGFTPPSGVVSGETFPLSSRYYDIISGRQNLTLLISNLNMASAQANPSQSVSYSILLNQSKIDDNFLATSAGIFIKADVSDLTNWYVKDLFGVSGVESPFPSPFLVDGKRTVFIPVTAQNAVRGTISIFSSSMDLVFSAEQTSIFLAQLGRQVFHWDGKNNGNDVASSGIYFYVIESPGHSRTGKIAVIRK